MSLVALCSRSLSLPEESTSPLSAFSMSARRSISSRLRRDSSDFAAKRFSKAPCILFRLKLTRPSADNSFYCLICDPVASSVVGHQSRSSGIWHDSGIIQQQRECKREDPFTSKDVVIRRLRKESKKASNDQKEWQNARIEMLRGRKV